jgi:hypothetical protein
VAEELVRFAEEMRGDSKRRAVQYEEGRWGLVGDGFQARVTSDAVEDLCQRISTWPGAAVLREAGHTALVQVTPDVHQLRRGCKTRLADKHGAWKANNTVVNIGRVDVHFEPPLPDRDEEKRLGQALVDWALSKQGPDRAPNPKRVTPSVFQ